MFHYTSRIKETFSTTFANFRFNQIDVSVVFICINFNKNSVPFIKSQLEPDSMTLKKERQKRRLNKLYTQRIFSSNTALKSIAKRIFIQNKWQRHAFFRIEKKFNSWFCFVLIIRRWVLSHSNILPFILYHFGALSVAFFFWFKIIAHLMDLFFSSFFFPSSIYFA